MKHLRLTLLIMLAVSVSTAYGFKKGDLNEDGAVDGSDMSILAEIVLGGDDGSTTGVSYTIGGAKFTMIEIPGGTFTMGGTAEQFDEAGTNEFPIHNVTLDTYWIGQTEVTQELWTMIMGNGNNPSGFSGANLPVENVSWNDCQEFISRLNALTGLTFRLPTEAEWEYASRGGQSCGCKYAGSNNINDVAWYKDNSSNMSHPVATKQPNELGLYDMCGNVFEWCQDCYGDYSADTQTNPTGTESGQRRVGRGGSWQHGSANARVSCRVYGLSSGHANYLGLRLAR